MVNASKESVGRRKERVLRITLVLGLSLALGLRLDLLFYLQFTTCKRCLSCLSVSTQSVHVDDGTFSWGEELDPVLKK